jgi:hypothetical protein
MAQDAGFLRVVTPEDVTAQEKAASDLLVDRAKNNEEVPTSELRNYIETQWAVARDHRSTSNLDLRLMEALRAFNGTYSPNSLAEIRRFGGSQVYARITANKCRGATALLRDIYFSAERPWKIDPTDSPSIRVDILAKIPELVQMETNALREAGEPVDPAMVADRIKQLQDEARRATIRTARAEAINTERKLNDYLQEGGFYDALAEFLVDLPLFPFAVIKGPFVRMVNDVHWVEGEAIEEVRPRMVWERCSPFDIYFTPGAASARQSDIIQRLRWSRADLNELLGLPGWDQEAVRGALTEYDGGLRDWMDPIDSERAWEEGREDPGWNRSHYIDALEFHGSIKGSTLRDIGFDAENDGVDDIDRDYSVQAWVCGDFILKVQINPSPRKRHPYFITSFEKVPGTPAGNALPDILEDIQQVANAALRALSNNQSLASGPQVVVMDNRFSETADTDELYPWKRWHMMDEPGSGNQPPVSFYQPKSNAPELLSVYQKMSEVADEVSAIPRYLTGTGAPGGAGRTASGLSMLMGNANKMLQQVASNIDLDILAPTITALYDLILLTSEDGEFRGDEQIVVKGASMVLAKEAERSRQLEFLQITQNEIDQQIVGVEGRATILRAVARDIGLGGERIVPSETELANQRQQAQIAAEQEAAAAAQGDQAPGPEGPGAGPQTNEVVTRNLQQQA